MRILGVDPALSITGYGVIESQNDKIFLVEAGIISTSAKDKVTQRLDKIYRAIKKLIFDTKPDVLVLEKLYAHYRHPTTAFILGQARGVICLACETAKNTSCRYSATRIKKATVGQGLASKTQVAKMIVNLLNLKSLPKYTDVTDALALAIAHSYIMKGVRL